MSKVLEKYFGPDSIKLSYYRVQCWTDKMIKDQVGLRAFGQKLDENCKELSEKIISGDYKPQRGVKFYVPKASKTSRTKTMLFLEDALVYQAIANSIAEKNFDILQEQDSFVFGSVLSDNTKLGTGLLNEEKPNYFFFKFWKQLFQKFKDSVIQSIEVDKVKYKFETDITGFFDCIPHYNLLSKLSDKFGVEDEILDMLSSCLNLWSGTRESITPGVGIPQGPLPSFLLANILLNDLDDLIINQGFKYYRYMDDIKIYGYEERELVGALVTIDMYLKGNGLSINSKKTSIQRITEDEEDQTIKEMKKLDLFSLYDIDGNEIEITAIWPTSNAESDKGGDEGSKEQAQNEASQELDSAANLSEQDGGELYFDKSKVDVLKNEDEIVAYYESVCSEVSTTLPGFFENPKDGIGELILKEGIDDVDFIRCSAQYGTCFRGLKSYKTEVKPDETILKYWLFAYKNFFWRANNYGLTLTNYRNNKELKSSLLGLIKGDFKIYEWSRHQAIQTLSLCQAFSDQELRTEILEMLKSEQSDLAKISWYRLMFANSKNAQLLKTVERNLEKERSRYLKLLVTDFIKNHNSGEIDVVKFFNSIGI